MAKVVDIASDIWKFELNETTETSVAFIAQKLRASVGKLNDLLNTNFYVDETTFEIIDADNGLEIALDQVAIFTNLYLDYYYSTQVKAFLGAGGADSIQSIDQDGVKVTLVQKNQTAKIYTDLKKQNSEALRQLLNAYKIRKYSPKQVTGDDYLPKRTPLIIDPTNNATDIREI